jgi:hypothetical protein
MKKQKRVPSRENGVCVVPLGPDGSKGMAYILAEHFDYLTQELGLSSQWNLSSRGYVVASAHRAPGASVLVARVLLGCRAGETVAYRDGQPTNLLEDNLSVKRGGYALNDARAYVTPREEMPAAYRLEMLRSGFLR